VPRSAPRDNVPPGSNVIAFPGVERELVLELATALARYGASATSLQRLRRARRPDAALMRHAYHELRRLGGHHWLLAVVRAADPTALSELLDALRGSRFAAGTLAPVTYILFQFVMVNMMLGVFNLIPIPPLDGSGVVVSVVGDPAARLYAIIAPFGFLILILLISTRILRVIFAPFQYLVLRLVFGG